MRKSSFFLFFVVMVLLFTVSVHCALADTVEADGIKLTLETKKSVYQEDEDIDARLTILNQSGKTITQVRLVQYALSGYGWKDGSEPVKQIGMLFSGESASASAVHTLNENAAVVPATGDSGNPVLWGALLLISGAVCLFLARRNPRGFTALMLCVVLLSGTVFANAEERRDNVWPWKMKTFSRSAAVQSDTYHLSVSHRITVGGEQVELRAVLTYEILSTGDNLDDGEIDVGDLELLNLSGKVEVGYKMDGRISLIDGSFTNQKITSAAKAGQVLEEAADLFSDEFAQHLRNTLRSNPDAIAKQTSENGDGIIKHYYRYTPSVSGIPVNGSQIVMRTDANGQLETLTNGYVPQIEDINTRSTISKEDAVAAAKKAMIEGDFRELFAQTEQLFPGKTQAEREQIFFSCFDFEAALEIYAADTALPVSLVYAVQVTINENVELAELPADSEDLPRMPAYNSTYRIYANTAAAKTLHSCRSNLTTSWGWNPSTLNHSGVTLNTEVKDGVHRLHDTVRDIQTRRTEGKYRTWPFEAVWIERPGEYFATNVSAGVAPITRRAAMLHSNFAKAYDFYKTLGRNSYDNRGGEIIVFSGWWGKSEEADEIYYDMNACWDGFHKDFGFGDSYAAEAALDVVGHEFTHAVFDYTSDLEYSGESGATEEAFCDIMGGLIENKSGAGRWIHAEDSADPNPRYFKEIDQNSSAQATHYENVFVTQLDNGGVHMFSTVFSIAACQMMTDDRTSSVSVRKWAQVFYDALQNLTENTTFLDARYVLCEAARSNGFTDAQMTAVEAAFDMVGICEPDLVHIVLTWGSKPEDLDSHLVGPAARGSGKFHVYYGQMSYDRNGSYDTERNLIAELDYDDVTSYGPELTTIHLNGNAEYEYFVHDFTNGGTNGSRALANSGAKVVVWKPGYDRDMTDYFNTFTVPAGTGTYWDVCRITVEEFDGDYYVEIETDEFDSVTETTTFLPMNEQW